MPTPKIDPATIEKTGFPLNQWEKYIKGPSEYGANLDYLGKCGLSPAEQGEYLSWCRDWYVRIIGWVNKAFLVAMCVALLSVFLSIAYDVGGINERARTGARGGSSVDANTCCE